MKMKFLTLLVSVTLLSPIVARSQNNDEPKGQIAAEMAGKWCYIPNTAESMESMTNSCITLNADGTYEIQVDPSTMKSVGGSLGPMANSDSGTWRVLGNVIYYNSNAAGKGSFRFQKANHPRLDKTPVIILNGAIFCSATPRDPW